jgi:hypothetical protein
MSAKQETIKIKRLNEFIAESEIYQQMFDNFVI